MMALPKHCCTRCYSTGSKMAGEGVTAALLRQNGIAVFAPADIEKLAASLSSF
ncbi:MAG: hypothetical protein ACTINM_02255 [Acetobacter cibinongensis]